MIEQPGQPQLRIIGVKDLVLHEEADAKRTAGIKKRLVDEGRLANPVMVTPLGKGKYLVLDGANRVSALREIKMPHALVQVLDYGPPQVALRTWNHLICDSRFAEEYEKKVKIFGAGDLDKLGPFTALYKGRYQYHRVVGADFEKMKTQYPDATCLVVFPKFKPDHIKRFAREGFRVPAGITRHVIQGRAMRLNIPLDVLRAKKALPAKNKWLAGYVASLADRNRIRYYAESVFLFDE